METKQDYNKNNIPLVSISCITYQHAPYIRQCLDGFMMQKTDFAFEVLIHDDASTDGTEEIIREYEAKYPDIIKPLYEKENQWVKGRRGSAVFNFPRAKGKYIALCEGDDYWTDPLKLQKQVDFLEGNEEYNLCVSGFNQYNVYTKKTESIIKIPQGVETNKYGYSFSLVDTKKDWLTKSLTAVFFNDKKVFESLESYKYGRDINLFYHILKEGKGFYFTEEMGVYQIHEGGINSMKQGKVNTLAAYNVYKELYEVNKDEWTRYMNIRHTLSYFNYNLYENKLWKESIVLYVQAINLVRNIKDVRLLITNLLSSSLKSKLRK